MVRVHLLSLQEFTSMDYLQSKRWNNTLEGLTNYQGYRGKSQRNDHRRNLWNKLYLHQRVRCQSQLARPNESAHRVRVARRTMLCHWWKTSTTTSHSRCLMRGGSYRQNKNAAGGCLWIDRALLLLRGLESGCVQVQYVRLCFCPN